MSEKRVCKKVGIKNQTLTHWCQMIKRWHSKWRQNKPRKKPNNNGNRKQNHCRKKWHIARTHFNRLLNIKWKHIHFINSTSLLITWVTRWNFPLLLSQHQSVNPAIRVLCALIVVFIYDEDFIVLMCCAIRRSLQTPQKIERTHTPTLPSLSKKRQGTNRREQVKWVYFPFIFALSSVIYEYSSLFFGPHTASADGLKSEIEIIFWIIWYVVDG